MNFWITKKIAVQTFQYNAHRFLYVPRNINKYSSVHNIIKQDRNENRSFCFPLSKQPLSNVLCNVRTPFLINCQRHVSTKDSVTQDLHFEGRTVFEGLPYAKNVTVEMLNNEPEFVTTIFMYLSKNPAVQYFQEALVNLHEDTGLPWWSIFAITGLGITLGNLPLYLRETVAKSRLQLVNLDAIIYKDKLSKAEKKTMIKYNWPKDFLVQKSTDKERDYYRRQYKKLKVSPIESVFSFSIKLFVWATATSGIRNLCYILPVQNEKAINIYNELLTDGMFWITNLADVDKYALIPISICLLNLLTIQVHYLFKVNPLTDVDENHKNVAETMAVLLLPCSFLLPVAVNIFWMSCSTSTLALHFLLNTAVARRLLGATNAIPELEKPYHYFYKNLRIKLKIDPMPALPEPSKKLLK